MEKLNKFLKRYLSRSWDWLLVVYCLPWGIYKVFFQTHHSVYSITFGSIMIVGAIGIVATNVLELRKKRSLNKSS